MGNLGFGTPQDPERVKLELGSDLPTDVLVVAVPRGNLATFNELAEQIRARTGITLESRVIRAKDVASAIQGMVKDRAKPVDLVLVDSDLEEIVRKDQATASQVFSRIEI